MKNRYCVVFADAFSYEMYCLCGGLRGAAAPVRLLPGIGYSSNLHYQIFQGKGPDEAGFFTDVALKSREPAGTVSRFKRACDGVQTLNNGYRYLLRRFRGRTDNIPFCERERFAASGSYLFGGASVLEIFGQPFRVLQEGSAAATFARAKAETAGGRENLLLVVNEMDHEGHRLAMDRGRYSEVGRDLLHRTDELFSLFSAGTGGDNCLFLSDHGMAEVVGGIDLLNSLFSKFGYPGREYFVYADSVLLRIWSGRPELLRELEAHLDRLSVLRRIGGEARREYHAANPEFGDLIYCLKKGYVFLPNCFGVTLKSLVSGMHGYLEGDDDTSGVVVSSLLGGELTEISTREIYGVLTKAISLREA